MKPLARDLSGFHSGNRKEKRMDSISVWPAEWKVFLYFAGGLPSDATKIGRRNRSNICEPVS